MWRSLEENTQSNHSHILQATKKKKVQYPVVNLELFPQKPSAVKSYKVSQDNMFMASPVFWVIAIIRNLFSEDASVKE